MSDAGDDMPVAELTFEAAMAELERVVGRLESGDVPLADSIRLYERGDALRKRCEGLLREAEQKVEQITTDAEGAATGTRALDG
jgi:exodeoxyribonuclease VII small subunit